MGDQISDTQSPETWQIGWVSRKEGGWKDLPCQRVTSPPGRQSTNPAVLDTGIRRENEPSSSSGVIETVGVVVGFWLDLPPSSL